MYIYGEDISVTPNIPGMRNNEVVTFTIDDIAATPSVTLLWTNDKDLHQVDLSSMGTSANFSASPTSGVAPLSVQFSDTSSGSISSWSWNFGDGQTSTSQNPQHTYTNTGTYTVSLSVNGSSGSDSETKTNYIAVYAPVVAGFTADPTEGMAPLTVSFNDTSTGNPTTWLWNFGDGGTSILQHPSHQYLVSGNYLVNLIVTGPGGTDSFQASVNVLPYQYYLPMINR